MRVEHILMQARTALQTIVVKVSDMLLDMRGRLLVENVS
jgi:hypothetical protein